MSKYIIIVVALLALTGKSPAEALPTTTTIIDGYGTQQIFELADTAASATINVTIAVTKKLIAAGEQYCAEHPNRWPTPAIRATAFAGRFLARVVGCFGHVTPRQNKEPFPGDVAQGRLVRVAGVDVVQRTPGGEGDAFHAEAVDVGRALGEGELPGRETRRGCGRRPQGLLPGRG